MEWLQFARWAAVVALICLPACSRASSEPATEADPAGVAGPTDALRPRPTRAVANEAAAELVVRFECARCHDGPTFPSVSIERSCVECHRQILEGTFDAAPETLVAWRENLVSLRQAPSLAHAGKRLRRSWVAEHLRQPRKTRPRLPASMPRLEIADDEAAALAALVVPEPSEPAPIPAAPSDLTRGAVLYEQLGCRSCHLFSGLQSGDVAASVPEQLADQVTTAAIEAAPDLALARARLRPRATVEWLRSPASQDPGAQMPDFGLDSDDARALAVFVLRAPLTPPPRRLPPTRLPLLERRVSYQEVSERVFRKTCWHCHSNADLAGGDGGPGNTGGFGFAPRGLDLSSYRGIAAGSLDDDGERRSIFLPTASVESVLVDRLLRRQREESGEVGDGPPGMPLGLPALTAEELQLVESWVAQGRPR